MNEYRVDTPENITFSYQVAGIGSRFLAALIDTAVILGVLMVLYIGVGMFYSTPAGQVLAGTIAEGWLIAGFFLLTFSIYWGYYIFFELIWNGQSLGKRAVGLRVMRMDGTPVTVVDSIVRNIIRLVDLLPLYYGVGVITMFLNPLARRLGDLAAGTIVVRERREVTLKNLAFTAAQAVQPVPADLPVEVDLWPLERLTENDYYVVTEFLSRCDRLPNRDILSQRIAASIRPRLDLGDDPITVAQANEFLALLAAAWRRQAARAAQSAPEPVAVFPVPKTG